MNIPVLISAVCVTLYWVTVVVKSIRLARKIGKDPNVVPRERVGQLTRVIWAPAIVVWIVLLWIGVFSTPTFPSFILDIAALIVIVATVLTFWCWHQMGRSWRIGIDPNEKTQLIITGPYRYVLHPIYSLSMIIAIATWVTLPTLPVLVVVFIHVAMLNIEARREEGHLLKVHGDSYRSYKTTVGRFFPNCNFFCRQGNV